jgi:hypothetical protein
MGASVEGKGPPVLQSFTVNVDMQSQNSKS